MTRNEMIDAFEGISAVYPQFYAGLDDGKALKAVIAWTELFENVSTEKFNAAKKTYMERDTFGKPPWPGTLFAILAEMPSVKFVQTGTDDAGMPEGRFEVVK